MSQQRPTLLRDLPVQVLLPLRDPVQVFDEAMVSCADQHYETPRLVEMLIDAACSHQAKLQLEEVVEWFYRQHHPSEQAHVKQCIETLAAQILYVVDSFRSRLPDHRFPYVHVPAPADLAALDFYVMRRFEIGLDTPIQP